MLNIAKTHKFHIIFDILFSFSSFFMRISALGSFLFNVVENDARLVEIDTFDEKSIHRSFVLSNKKVSGEFSLWADLKKDVTARCHDDALTGGIPVLGKTCRWAKRVAHSIVVRLFFSHKIFSSLHQLAVPVS
jgi:hypothetical protein